MKAKNYYENQQQQYADHELMEYYKLYVDYLFKNNDTGAEAIDILRLKHQLSFDSYCKLYNKGAKIAELTSKLISSPKYLEDKQVLATVLNTWHKNNEKYNK